MLGLKRGTVKLIPHQTQWHDEFLKEKNILQSILTTDIAIEHVGSTAVSDLVSKPIIDIILGLARTSNSEQIFKILSDNGYEYREEVSEGDHLFVKGNKDTRTHHLHIIEKNLIVWNNYISFRDYLRQHKITCNEYQELKESLAKKYPHNREAYTNGKADFINKVLNKAKML